MENTTDPEENLIHDPLAELVQAVRLSLLPSTPINPSSVTDEILHSVLQLILPQNPAALSAASASPMAH